MLPAFFGLGAYLSFFASDEAAADYARWGYPGWFHYPTAFLELTTALLLLLKRTRLLSGLLGSAVMLAAVGTVVFHGEYTHALAPLIVFGLCLAVAASGRK